MKKNMTKNISLLSVCCVLALAACSGRESYTSSPPWKETDKHLNCDQLLLEMNDAKFWNTAARNNQQAGFTDFLLPLSYMNTRASADEAIASTQARLANLNNIYQIKGCAKPYEDTPIPAPPVTQ
jgi:hypothetical protein